MINFMISKPYMIRMGKNGLKSILLRLNKSRVPDNLTNPEEFANMEVYHIFVNGIWLESSIQWLC